MKLLERAAGHPVSVIMVYTGVLLFGLVSLFKLNVELLPTINIPVAHVITEYPNIPSSEVEQLVTIPLENALSSVKGVKQLNSITKQGISSVDLRFDWGSNIDKVAVEIREKIDSAYPFLPYGIKKPLVFTEDLSDVPVITLAVFPKGNSTIEEISDTVKKELKTRLLQIKGVSDLRIVGATEPEIKIVVDAYKLYAANIPISQIIETVGSSIYEYPAGKITEGDLEYLVKASTGVTSIEEIKNLPILTGTGTVGLHISDLAAVYPGIKMRTSFFHMNGKDAIGIFINKTGDSGTLNASGNILKDLEDIKEIFRKELSIEVIEDRSDEIRASIKSLFIAIALGIIAAFIVLFFFFKKRAIPLITIISVPASMTSVFLFMYISNISLNIISLSGIAIGIGMIVDNSIVVLENLLKNRAKSPKEIASSTIEMGSSTFASTVTTLLVFLPVLFIPGITGALFKELALTISFLIASSFIISMTLAPALYSLFLAQLPPEQDGMAFKRTRLSLRYRRMLCFMIRKPVFPIFILVLVAGLGSMLFLALPKEIIPEVDRGKLEAIFSFRRGITAEDSSSLTKEIEISLLELGEADIIYSEAGFDKTSVKDKASSGRDLATVRTGIILNKKRSASIWEAKSLIAGHLENEGDFNFQVKIPDDVIKKLLNAEGSIQFLLTGTDREKLIYDAEAIVKQAREKNLISIADIDTKKESPEIHLNLKSDSLAYSSLQPSGILNAMSSSIRGTVATKLKTDEGETDIRVRLRKEQTSTIEKLEKLKVKSPNGFLEIGNLGDLSKDLAFSEIFRRNRKMSVEITFLPQPGREKILKNYLLSIQNEYNTTSSQTALERSFKEIGMVFILAVILMYLILGAQFESFTVPLLLLISLPLSLFGSLLLLFITGKSININSFLGILILLGTTINTSIILCASFGKGSFPEIISGSISRLKPILATVCTTIFALLPIAVNPSAENTIQSNTAISVVGGLFSGTLTTLIIFPVIYFYLKRKSHH